MIYFLRGQDYMWKKLLLNGLVKDWPSCETIWVPEVSDEWLLSYVYDGDHLILRGCDKIGMEFYKPIKDWRDGGKTLIFEAEDMPAGKVRRRLLRLSRHVECDTGTKEARAAIGKLAARMGAGGDLLDRALKIGSVTRGYWFFRLFRMGADMERYLREEARRSARPWDVIWWRRGVLQMTVPELLLLMRGIARIAVLAREDSVRGKWAMRQEAIRTDHTQVPGLYGAGKVLADEPSLLEKFLRRAEVISAVLALDPDAPMEYIYLRAA